MCMRVLYVFLLFLHFYLLVYICEVNRCISCVVLYCQFSYINIIFVIIYLVGPYYQESHLLQMILHYLFTYLGIRTDVQIKCFRHVGLDLPNVVFSPYISVSVLSLPHILFIFILLKSYNEGKYIVKIYLLF